KTVRKALGGSLLKLFLPSVHCFRNRSLRTWPTIRLGRSEKKAVTGDTSCKVKTPSLNATCFAVCTKGTEPRWGLTWFARLRSSRNPDLGTHQSAVLIALLLATSCLCLPDQMLPSNRGCASPSGNWREPLDA